MEFIVKAFAAAAFGSFYLFAVFGIASLFSPNEEEES